MTIKKQPLNVTFMTESLIHSEAQVIGHQCNCTALRSRGLTAKIFGLWPSADTYEKRIEEGPTQLGTCSIHAKEKHGFFVANLYAQTKAKQATTEAEWVERRTALSDALKAVSKEMPDLKVLALPAMIGSRRQGESENQALQPVFEWARDHPKIRIWLHRPLEIKTKHALSETGIGEGEDDPTIPVASVRAAAKQIEKTDCQDISIHVLTIIY